MTPDREYRRLRNKGWRASEAFRAARIRADFQAHQDNVRLSIEPDDCVDLDNIIPDFYTPREREAEIKRIDWHGVWGLVGEFLDPLTRQWVRADAVWGFVGEDWKDSGYDDDIRASALDAYRDACANLRRRAQYFAI